MESDEDKDRRNLEQINGDEMIELEPGLIVGQGKIICFDESESPHDRPESTRAGKEVNAEKHEEHIKQHEHSVHHWNAEDKREASMLMGMLGETPMPDSIIKTYRQFSPAKQEKIAKLAGQTHTEDTLVAKAQMIYFEKLRTKTDMFDFLINELKGRVTGLERSLEYHKREHEPF